jgi:hypothetical protein
MSLAKAFILVAPKERVVHEENIVYSDEQKGASVLRNFFRGIPVKFSILVPPIREEEFE